MSKPIHPLSKAKLKFNRHKAQSKFRSIQFNFTFEEWYNWWLFHNVDKNVDQKWIGGTRPCMCRIGDIGPYEISNVYFAMDNENVKDLHKNDKANQQGYKTKKTLRYGNELFSKKEFTTKFPYLDDYSCSKFKIEKYDSENIKESLRLQKQWNNLPQFWWCQTDLGCFNTYEDAAKCHNITKVAMVSRFDRLKNNTNKTDWAYKIYKIKKGGLTCEQYIRKNSRYPDPFLDLN